MNQGNLKIIIIVSLFFSSGFNHAQTRPQTVLAKQCYELGGLVFSLISHQKKAICIDKLEHGADLLERAGQHILDNTYPLAQIELTNAMYQLSQAQLLSCARYIEIGHSKLEVKKIKDAL